MDIPNTLQIENIIINRITHTKYLGLIIDEQLSWKEHIHQLCNKLKGLFPIFYDIKNYKFNTFSNYLLCHGIIQN